MRRLLATVVGCGLGGLVVLGSACDEDAGAADVCADTRCVSAPPPVCEGNTKVVFQAVGTCTEDPTGTALCAYPVAQRQDCGLLNGKECRQGQCLDKPIIPCDGVVCRTPPAADCLANISQIYAGNGTCNPATPPAGACEYPVIDAQDCTPLGRICRAGSCVDPSTTPCEPNPCNVPPLGSCQGNVPQTAAALGTCTQIQVDAKPAARCDYALTSGAACALPTAECHLGTCARGVEAPAKLGDLVITEVMKNPTAEGDEGEWFELYNTTTAALELDGCILSDDGNEDHTIGEVSLVVPAKGYITLGRSADPKQSGGLTPDYVYSQLTLGNTADEIILTCTNVEIDRVAWIEGWPAGIGLSLSLNPTAFGDGTNQAVAATANDAVSAWCNAPAPYGDGTNEGSPRRPNAACR